MNDFDLYRRFKRGDESAFEELYKRYSVRLYNYILRIVGDADMAEDILEETFIKLYFSDLVERAKLSSWIYRVATNLSYKRMRRRKRESYLEGDESKIFLNPRSPLKDEVEEALLLLPEHHRVVLVLKFFEGKTCGEISEILGCPEGTVKSRLHYAISKLKSYFMEEKNEM
jgi:RNA polymerase sigma-70 factor (ECF subfamily)